MSSKGHIKFVDEVRARSTSASSPSVQRIEISQQNSGNINYNNLSLWDSYAEIPACRTGKPQQDAADSPLAGPKNIFEAAERGMTGYIVR